VIYINTIGVFPKPGKPFHAEKPTGNFYIRHEAGDENTSPEKIEKGEANSLVIVIIIFKTTRKYI